MFRQSATQVDSAVACCALLGGDYSGRLKGFVKKEQQWLLRKGLKVPAVVVMVPVRDIDSVEPMVGWILDRLNQRYHLGLITHPLDVRGHQVYAIEATGDNQYAQFGRNERIAYTMVDNWLVLCSNAKSLQRACMSR